jgi:hypothetical protein
MSYDALIEFNHLALQNAREAAGTNVFTLVGQVSGVDPTTNRIKVVIPSWTNDNTTYMESGWIPLGTPVAGNRYGIQLLPFGQATVKDPLAQKNSQNGNTPMTEQVLVHVLGTKRGLYIQSVQMFNQVDIPPSGYQDDISNVKASNGEWLLKHSTGSYLYFANDNTVDLLNLINPAPVVQTDQTPDSVSPVFNFGIVADGVNSNKNGSKPQTVSTQLNIKNTVTGGTTNNATTAETISSDTQGVASKSLNITADNTQGAGRYTINIAANDAELTINITGNNNTYNLNVPDGTVNVTSDTTNVKSDTVNLGTGVMKALLTDVYAQWMEGHTHSGVQTGSGESGPMVQQVSADQEAKNANAS